MVNLNLNKKQFLTLLKLIYLGNWLVNAIRSQKEQIKEYEDFEQLIFSFAKEVGLEKYIEYSEEYKCFFPTIELEEDPKLEQFLEDYDEDIFWEELVSRLSRRDFVKFYGLETIKKMDFWERIKKEQPFLDRYGEEIEENGIDNLEIIATELELLPAES